MTDRADKRLVFKPLNNRRFLHGETEPCINGRILAAPSLEIGVRQFHTPR